jgi:hypothetical protein
METLQGVKLLSAACRPLTESHQITRFPPRFAIRNAICFGKLRNQPTPNSDDANPSVGDLPAETHVYRGPALQCSNSGCHETE